jgi:hypothetical protein
MVEEKSKVHDFFLKNGFLPTDKKAFSLLMNYQGDTAFAETSAALILSWSFKYKGLYKVINGFLSIVYFHEAFPVYFTIHRPPEQNEYALQSVVDILFCLSRMAGLPFLQIRCIEERFLKNFEGIDGYDIRTEYRDNDSEYAYRTDDFFDMAGHINEDKRWRYNKCLRKTNISFRPITKQDIGLCLEIQNDWCRGKDCSICESFVGCEKKALEIMIDIFDERFYRGLFLCCDGIPAGYGIGELLNPKTAVIYFGKSSINDYLFYIVYMMTKTFFNDIEYLNLDSDVGNEGLRTFKRHLGPYELWRKYICTYTGPEKRTYER